MNYYRLDALHSHIFDYLSGLEVHADWFIARLFTGADYNLIFDSDDERRHQIADSIISGHKSAIDKIQGHLKKSQDGPKSLPETFTIYPRNVIKLRYSIGIGPDRENLG